MGRRVDFVALGSGQRGFGRNQFGCFLGIEALIELSIGGHDEFEHVWIVAQQGLEQLADALRVLQALFGGGQGLFVTQGFDDVEAIQPWIGQTNHQG